MSHIHEVLDDDKLFIIDPATREITNLSENDVVLIQGDHNSEIFSIAVPKQIERHDMTLCNKIRIHFLNIGNEGESNSDVYEVPKEDIAVEKIQFEGENTVEDYVVCKWVVSRNATKYAGSLSFIVEYLCVSEANPDNPDYEWHSAIYANGVRISDGMDFGKATTEQYSDILQQWYNGFMNHINTVTREEVQSYIENTAKPEMDEYVKKEISKGRLFVLGRFDISTTFSTIADTTKPYTNSWTVEDFNRPPVDGERFEGIGLSGDDILFYYNAVITLKNGEYSVDGNGVKYAPFKIESVAEIHLKDGYVKKAGDTMTGPLTINNPRATAIRFPGKQGQVGELCTDASDTVILMNKNTSNGKFNKLAIEDYSVGVTKAVRLYTNNIREGVTSYITMYGSHNLTPSDYAKKADLTGGAIKVNLAATADKATQATYDGQGQTIHSVYAKKNDLYAGNITVAKAKEADKATQDSDGNVIKDIYAKKADLTSGELSVYKAARDANGNIIATTYLTKTEAKPLKARSLYVNYVSIAGETKWETIGGVNTYFAINFTTITNAPMDFTSITTVEELVKWFNDNIGADITIPAHGSRLSRAENEPEDEYIGLYLSRSNPDSTYATRLVAETNMCDEKNLYKDLSVSGKSFPLITPIT